MKTLWMTIAALLALASNACADVGDIYDCKFNVSRHEYLAEQVIFGVVEKDKKVTVYDAIIHYTNGEPVNAEILRDDEKRFTIRWLLEAPDANGRVAKLSFRLTYLKQNKKATMSMIVRGFDNRYNTQGKCSVAKGNI